MGLSLSSHGAPFVEDQKLQEFGETLGNPVAYALVALFSTVCCRLTAIMALYMVIKVNIDSLPLMAGEVASLIYDVRKTMYPWTRDFSSVFIQSLLARNCQSRKSTGRAGTSVLGGPGVFFWKQELMQNHMGSCKCRGISGCLLSGAILLNHYYKAE